MIAMVMDELFCRKRWWWWKERRMTYVSRNTSVRSRL